MSYISQHFGPVTLLLWPPPPPPSPPPPPLPPPPIIIIIIIIHKHMIYGSHHYFFPAYLCPVFSTAVMKHHQSRCKLLTVALLKIQVFKGHHTVPQGVWFHIF
jgi:hypothetical protein